MMIELLPDNQFEYSPICEMARAFSKWVHRHQKRKYTNEPYFNHCEQVAKLILTYVPVVDTGHELMVAAAYLHDCVEDQEVTPELLISLFSEDLCKMVLEVTDVSKPSDGNREKRKEIDRMHLAKASKYGKTIKLADLVSNTSSIMQHDPEFAVTYLREKRLLMPYLTEGDPTLYKMAMEYVQI